MSEFNLSEKRRKLFNEQIEDESLTKKWAEWFLEEIEKQDKEFIKRRIERIKLCIKLYPHKHGDELAGELIADLLNDAGDDLK